MSRFFQRSTLLGYEVYCERTKLWDFLAFFCCGTWREMNAGDEDEKYGYYIFPTRETGYHFLSLIRGTGYFWADDIDRASKFPASLPFLEEMYKARHNDKHDLGWVKIVNEYCPECGNQSLQEYHDGLGNYWLECDCDYCHYLDTSWENDY